MEWVNTQKVIVLCKLFFFSITSSTDQGIVLTTDTDSFIIGQRVWVGGVRPGHIAYIGETHFAPGDWAGVVLDEPSGELLLESFVYKRD